MGKTYIKEEGGKKVLYEESPFIFGDRKLGDLHENFDGSFETRNAGGAGGTRVGVIPAGTVEETPTETPVETVTPEVTTPPAPAAGGLAGITGAVIGAAKNNSTVLIVIVSVVVVILVLTRVSIRNPFGKGKGKNYKPSAKYE